MSHGHVCFQAFIPIYPVSALILMVSGTQLKAFCDPSSSSSTRHNKNPNTFTERTHEHTGFTEMWVENRRACHCKHRHPQLPVESWAPMALGCTLIITTQEDVMWPSIPFVTYPEPVFWLLSLISLLSSLLSFPSAQPLMNEANSSPCFLWYS